jgi:hypothetical protein
MRVNVSVGSRKASIATISCANPTGKIRRPCCPKHCGYAAKIDDFSDERRTLPEIQYRCRMHSPRNDLIDVTQWQWMWDISILVHDLRYRTELSPDPKSDSSNRLLLIGASPQQLVQNVWISRFIRDVISFMKTGNCRIFSA